ncbi:nickel/cobalt ABC transporter permease [Desulfosporosinus sp. BG]|uniref:nickel/cobalt ABC transporter permease n=1 Tax=Desulfosporosinus sp. BG TaxID=1633135 RepID=UPI00083B4575|nr:nickel/cobalt ABC transporter permease [Desulfosporosinus sp. BG]ODA42108.1 Dipeptide transport system permease protein DppB [Desulfosporosinus sp. BG]
MRAYLIKRLISLVPVLFGVTILTFVLIHMIPINPAQAYMTACKIPITEKSLSSVREELGVDRPLVEQYVSWLGKAIHLDFGKSYVSQDPVFDEITHCFPNTLLLTLAAFGWLILLSLPLGFLSALFKDSLFDHLSRVFTFVGASIPGFWLGFLLIQLFAIKLDILPIMGKGSWQHLILPSLTLASNYIAAYARILRAGVLENLNQPFILYAKARGLRQKIVFGKHALKNALLPVVNAFGVSFGYMLAGSVVVEVVFAWPGLGRLITSSIFNRDYPMIQGYVLLMAIVFVLSNLLADIVSTLIDPRIRIGDDQVAA